MKIKKTDLSTPITRYDTQRLALLANADAVFKIVCELSPLGSEVRTECAKLRRDVKRLERAIPGYMEEKSREEHAAVFYLEMEKAVNKFIKAVHNDGLPVVGRDEKGRWKKL